MRHRRVQCATHVCCACQREWDPSTLKGRRRGHGRGETGEGRRSTPICSANRQSSQMSPHVVPELLPLAFAALLKVSEVCACHDLLL